MSEKFPSRREIQTHQEKFETHKWIIKYDILNKNFDNLKLRMEFSEFS